QVSPVLIEAEHHRAVVVRDQELVTTETLRGTTEDLDEARRVIDGLASGPHVKRAVGCESETVGAIEIGIGGRHRPDRVVLAPARHRDDGAVVARQHAADAVVFLVGNVHRIVEATERNAARTLELSLRGWATIA